MVREAFTEMLNSVEDIEVVGVASSGEEAIKMAREKKPDVAIIDVYMPGIGGLEAAKRMLSHNPDIAIIGLSGLSDGPYPTLFIKAGARGYLHKESGKAELIKVVRLVAAGETYLAPELAHSIVSSNGQHDNPFDALSDREMQITLLTLNGLRPTDIAEQLKLSPKTVNSYRHRLFQKLNVGNEVELTLLAMRWGILAKPDAEND